MAAMWTFALARLAGILLLGLCVGLLIGPIWLWVLLSAQHEIVWFNRQAARLLGLRRPIDVGLRIDNLIRSPEFVHYLHGDDFAMPLVIRPPVQMDL